MREIKFRAVGLCNEGWVTGDLVRLEHETLIVPTGTAIAFSIPVIPSTVGQSTGRLDEIGKEIFEGDNGLVGNYKEICTVYWDDTKLAFCITSANPSLNLRLLADFTWEHHIIFRVIGNIHDNPELLEAK